MQPSSRTRQLNARITHLNPWLSVDPNTYPQTLNKNWENFPRKHGNMFSETFKKILALEQIEPITLSLYKCIKGELSQGKSIELNPIFSPAEHIHPMANCRNLKVLEV